MSSWLKACTVAMLMFGLAACAESETVKQQALVNGDRYFAEKQFDAAIVEYRNAVAQDEKFGLARYKLGQSYAALNDWRRAHRELVRAADLLPENAEVQVAAGRSLLLFAQFQDARTRAEQALKIDPKNMDAHLVRGAAAGGMRDWDGALDAFQEGLSGLPDRPELYLSVAMVQAAQGRKPEAEAAFKQAVVVDPKSVRPRLALANYYWTTERRAEAENELTQAIELEPNHALANSALASLYIATKRAAEAEEPLRRAAGAAE